MTRLRASVRLSANAIRIIELIQSIYPNLDRTGAIEYALTEWERLDSLEGRVKKLEEWRDEVQDKLS